VREKETSHKEFKIKKLKDEPAIGSSCCIILAEDLIRDGLSILKGIKQIQADADEGLLYVDYDPTILNSDKIKDLLVDIGYPPEDFFEGGL
jgi:copper chaperone CopZ